MISRSYIALNCIDRLCMSSPSVFLRRFSTKRIAIRLIILMPIIWYLIPSYVAILYMTQDQRCLITGTDAIVYSIYSIFVAGILLSLIMIVFTLLPYRNMQKVRECVAPTSLITQQRIQRQDQQFFDISICQTPVEQLLNFLGSRFLVYINVCATFYIYIWFFFNSTKDYM